MKHATSVALYEQWNRLRGNRRIAARADIEPRDFGALLPELFLIETDLARGAPFRFCGASMARRYGRDLEGESFLSLWRGDDRTLMRRNVSLLERRHAGMVLGIMAEGAGGGFTAFEMTLLPLRGTDRCDGALGCMVRIGGHDEANRIRSRIVAQDVRSFRFLDDDAETVRQRPADGLGLAVRTAAPARSFAAAPPIGSMAPAASRAHLTLLIGGK